MYSDESDKTIPGLVAEFIISHPVLSISALQDNAIALLGAGSANTVKLYDCKTKIDRSLSYVFPLSMLATSSDKDNKLIFSTLDNIHIENNESTGYRECKFIAYQTRLSDLISLHVTENKIITQTSNGIVIVDQDKANNKQRVITPQKLITNLPPRYFLAALDDDLLAIGFGKNVFILDLNAMQVQHQFTVHGEIQALARVNKDKLAIGLVEFEHKGIATRSKSSLDLCSMDEIPMDEIMHVAHHTRLNAVDLYDVNSRIPSNLLHWSNSKKINILVASYAGDCLVIGFEDNETAQAYTEVVDDSSSAGDLHRWKPPTILYQTHFMVYAFSKMDKP